MNFKTKLSQRINMKEVNEIVLLTNGNDNAKQELYNLIFDENERVSYQAIWVMTHFSTEENRWIFSKQDELINELMQCKHNGKRRTLLSLLYRQPLNNLFRMDFLDYCFEQLVSPKQPYAIQALCMKISYEACLSAPELLQELQTTLEMIEGELSPAVNATRKNILKAMRKRKSLQPTI